MPVNNAYDVEELFAACHDYFQKTGRRISFEYAMIDGVNDHDWQADLIARRIAGMPGHVNLIPLNDVVESPFKPSRRTAAFQKRLQSHGVTATVRRSLGGDIDASCGQLRRKAMEVFDMAIANGWDNEYGGILYFIDCKGFPPEAYEHDMKLWWPHNEALIASLMMYRDSGDEK